MKKLEEWITRFGERRLIIVIGLVAFVVQLIVMRAPVIYGEPYLVAKNIIAGKGFSFVYPLCDRAETTCYVTPLYVFLQIPILASGLGAIGIQVLNLLFLQAACLATYFFFRRFLTSGVALLAFIAISFYIPLWLLAYAMDPNSLNILLLILMADRLYEVHRNPSRRLWIQLGILFGLQLLVRPDILIGVVLFAIWMVLSTHDRRGLLKGIALSAAIGFLMVLPWTVRNYIEFHRFVLVSANSGYNLYVGNNWVATGEFSEEPATQESRKEYEAIMAYSKTHDQIELDHYRLQLSEAWMLSHPMEVIELDARKFVYHWFGRYEFGTQYHYGQGTLSAFYLGLSVILIAFGVRGWLALKDRALRGLLLTIFVYSTVVSVIFFVQSRHRTLKVDPFLVPMAVVGALQFSRSRSLNVIESPHIAIASK